MSLFLTTDEKRHIDEARQRGDVVLGRFWTALMSRASRRAASPGLFGQQEDALWWYPASEYLSDAAMAFALRPTPELQAWLRDTTLSVARRPLTDWVGPWFRDHETEPPVGHLETAHLCWAVATAVDLAAEVFSAAEQREINETLHEKGITLCTRWLERNTHLANWRAVMTAGVAVAAAVTGDREHLDFAAKETLVCAQAYQPDGSYAESLQYSNYLALALMMSYEAVRRVDPEIDVAGPETYARSMPWIAHSMLYVKPLQGWGSQPRARAVNFNDSAAVFRPSGDVLLQVAARCRTSLPTEAGLARWLFDTFYAPVPTQPPHNLASFGLRNDWGFLTLPFLAESPPAVSPEEADLPPAAGFANGNVLVRDAWNGRTVLALQAGSEPLCGPGHLHGDLGGFILVHNNERLLVDPGHSCYRNLIHGLESSTQTHNTCTFLVAEDELGLQEDLAKARLLEQSNVPPRRQIVDGQVTAPVEARGRRLLLARCDEVTAVGCDAAQLYGEPIEEFSRFWLQAGPHVLFVVDRIRASQPVRTVWNWLLNNHDNTSEVETIGSGEIVLRRQTAGMKLTHLAGGRLNGPVYAYVHDAYHVEPNRIGEGRPGSGMLYRWIEPSPQQARLAVHALAVDDYGTIDDWTVETESESHALGTCHGTTYDGLPRPSIPQSRRPWKAVVRREFGRAPVSAHTLQSENICWSLAVVSEAPLDLTLKCEMDGRRWRLVERDGTFSFNGVEGG